MLVVDVDHLVLEQRRPAVQSVDVLLEGRVDLEQRLVLLLGERLQQRLQLHLLPLNQRVGACERGIYLLVILLRRRRQQHKSVSGASVCLLQADVADAATTVLAQTPQRVARMTLAFAQHALSARTAAVHQTLDVLGVEVGLQGSDARGRYGGCLATRRAFDLVAHLADVLAQALLAERVVAWKKLRLGLVLIKETAKK